MITKHPNLVLLNVGLMWACTQIAPIVVASYMMVHLGDYDDRSDHGGMRYILLL